MKASINEFDRGGFGIQLEAENIEETTALVRLGLNTLATIPAPEVTVYKSSPTTAWFQIPCQKNKTATIKRGK